MNKLQSIICIFMLSLLWACSKDDGLSGPPSVRSVTLLDSARQDSAFTRALPGTLVLITGDNLDGITQVTFNGLNAYFNPAYNTNTHLIITIPEEAPTEATDPDVPNLIHIVTTHGETSYSFVVDIPPPSIFAISNENAMPGDSLYIFGSSLWLIEKIQFPGGREVTAFNADEEGTLVRLVMPNLGTDTGRVTIVAKYGSATSNGPLNDHQSGNVISNFTNDGETGELPRLTRRRGSKAWSSRLTSSWKRVEAPKSSSSTTSSSSSTAPATASRSISSGSSPSSQAGGKRTCSSLTGGSSRRRRRPRRCRPRRAARRPAPEAEGVQEQRPG